MSDSLFTFPPPSLDQQIKEIEREIAMRERVYPHQVASGRLTKARAEHQTACMVATLAVLRKATGQ